MKFKPWDYQQEAVQFILNHEKCGLFLEMGLGKTVITLTALAQLLEDYAVTRILVIAPLRVAQTVWAEEAAKWDHLRHLRVVKVLGSARQRMAALSSLVTRSPGRLTKPGEMQSVQDLADTASGPGRSSTSRRLPKGKSPEQTLSGSSGTQTCRQLQSQMEMPEIFVINRENVPWLIEYQRQRKKWPFDMIVIDELSSFKNPKAERFKALRLVTGITPRIVGLTGTPSPNGLMDLWSQIYLLDRGERLGKFITKYREAYFRPGKTNGQVVFSWEPLPGAPEAIYKKLSDLCMSMKTADYLTMPDRFDIEHRVVLDSGGKQAYELMEKHFVLSLGSEAITAQNAAVLTGKLLQLANGAIYSEDGNYYPIHDSKLDALEDLVEAANGQPVLVYYMFKHDADRILRRFPEARQLITPQDVIDWKAGRVPMMIAHPASAGHGLNLQDGGHIIIWFGLTWSLELYQQANARLHRQGQTHPVTVHHVIAEGTVDEDVLTVLTKKAGRQDALIDALKARFERYAS